MLPPPTSMERTKIPIKRSKIFPSSLAYKHARLIGFTALLAFFLLITLWTGVPSRLRSIPFGGTPLDAEIGVPAYRVPEPLYYEDEPSPPDWRYRSDAVKKAFLHAYHAYESNAFPADELWPLSNKPRQK